VKESSRKGQNRIKTGQKREAWQSREKSEAVTVDRERKIKQNAKRMAVKTVNKDVRLEALVDGKKVIVNEASIRRGLRLDDAEGKIPTDTQETPIDTQPSSLQPQRKHKSRKRQRKDAKVPQVETQNEESIPIPSNDPLSSGEDRMQLSELIEICTKLSDRVLSLEQDKVNQAVKIEKLKKRVKKLEGKKKKRTHGLKRLYKVRLSARVESSKDVEASLGD
nr:hypothetical protein [Tanacetum cinerariifolium]